MRDEHRAQLDEVVVLQVLDLDDAPGVQAAAHLPAAHLDSLVGADHGERHRLLQLLALALELVVLVGVALRDLVDLDAVLGQLRQDLQSGLRAVV